MPPPRKGVNKSQELIEAERAGQELLSHYCRAENGRQAELARATDIMPAIISRMVNAQAPISLEAALLFEVATSGHLRAEALCPSRAELLQEWLLNRAAAIGQAA